MWKYSLPPAIESTSNPLASANTARPDNIIEEMDALLTDNVNIDSPSSYISLKDSYSATVVTPSSEFYNQIIESIDKLRFISYAGYPIS